MLLGITSLGLIPFVTIWGSASHVWPILCCKIQGNKFYVFIEPLKIYIIWHNFFCIRSNKICWFLILLFFAISWPLLWDKRTIAKVEEAAGTSSFPANSKTCFIVLNECSQRCMGWIMIALGHCSGRSYWGWSTGGNCRGGRRF